MRAPWLWMAVVAAALGLTAGTAHGALSTKASLPTAAGATRIVVTVGGLGTVPVRERPTAISLVAGKATFRLTKVNARRWRSAPLKPAAISRLRALRGKRVTVRVRSRAGVRALRPLLGVPASTRAAPVLPGPGAPSPDPGQGTQPGPSGPGSLFTAPGSRLEGQAAYTHFARWFEGSRFTDCPAGWPACAVEERYNHCAGGAWEYFRLTPTSGSDIRSVGSFQVTGAVADTDGSWAVEYIVDAYGSQSFYSWRVAPDGTVNGGYWAPGNAPPSAPSQLLGPLRWQGPVTCGGSAY
jgi:hypothetical protein